ncbi:hypothetical protein D3C85_1490000 [compost metagenome]
MKGLDDQRAGRVQQPWHDLEQPLDRRLTQQREVADDDIHLAAELPGNDLCVGLLPKLSPGFTRLGHQFSDGIDALRADTRLSQCAHQPALSATQVEH